MKPPSSTQIGAAYHRCTYSAFAKRSITVHNGGRLWRLQHDQYDFILFASVLGLLFPLSAQALQASASSGVMTGPPPGPEHVRVVNGHLEAPASAGRATNVSVAPNGSRETHYADGSVLSAASMVTFTPQQVRAAGGVEGLSATIARTGSVRAYLESLGSTATNSAVRPDGSITSNCGTSYIYLRSPDYLGGRGYQYDTGFYDTCRARSLHTVDYRWETHAFGPGWNKVDRDYGPQYPVHTYDHPFYNHWKTANAGTYRIDVYGPGSFARLQNGGVAYSAEPNSATYVY